MHMYLSEVPKCPLLLGLLFTWLHLCALDQRVSSSGNTWRHFLAVTTLEWCATGI